MVQIVEDVPAGVYLGDAVDAMIKESQGKNSPGDSQ